MIAQLIEADLKAEITEAGRTITDPRALAKWMSAAGVGRSAMSAATGADFNEVFNKERAGNPYRDTPSDEYARLSLPLTPENYPGRPSDWERFRPDDVLIKRLSSALEDVVSVMYARFLGRWPDAAGRAHYEGQISGGRPDWEIVREIELSDEAQKR